MLWVIEMTKSSRTFNFTCANASPREPQETQNPTGEKEEQGDGVV